jgi:hypothetical protein
MKIHMHLKNKAWVITILTLIFISLLINIYLKTDYFPVSVTLDLKANADDKCKLLFETDEEPLKKLSVMRFASPGNYQLLTFLLPTNKFTNLRFVPGRRISEFQVRRIVMKAGPKVITWKPSEILTEFGLKDLVLSRTTDTIELSICSISSKDGQIQFPQEIAKQVSVIDFGRKNNLFIYTSIAYLFIVCMIIFIRRKIILSLKRKKQKILLLFSADYLSRNFEYIFFVIILSLLKGFLISAQQMVVRGTAWHDDVLFIRQAYSIASGNWLGDYDVLTLIKGFFYPLFIALTNAMGMPLFFGQQLLYTVACLIMVHALSPVLKSVNIKMLLFAILLFNPMSSADLTLIIIRDGFYTTLTLFVIAFFSGMYLRRTESIRTLRNWSLAASVSLFAFWNTREEGVIIMPLLFWFSILSIGGIIGNKNQECQSQRLLSCVKKRWHTLVLYLLPYIFLITCNFLVATFNAHRYGAFVVNEIKSQPFANACAALMRIKTDHWQANVPVLREAREKAYKISPSLAKLKPYLEAENNPWNKMGAGDSNEIKGGFFIWAFRDAASRAGFHKNLPLSRYYYTQVCREINAAFDSGYLDKTTKPSVFIVNWDNRYTIPVLNQIKEEIILTSTFQKYSPFSSESSGEITETIHFQDITSNVSRMPVERPNDIGSNKLKYELLNMISLLYSSLNPILFIVSVISYLSLSLFLLKREKPERPVKQWCFLTAIAVLLLLRFILIAFISVSQWNALGPKYLHMVYPFMLLFEVLSLYAIIDVFKDKFPRIGKLRFSNI